VQQGQSGDRVREQLVRGRVDRPHPVHHDNAHVPLVLLDEPAQRCRERDAFVRAGREFRDREFMRPAR